MLEAALKGLAVLLQPSGLLCLLGGTLFGMFNGIIPGLSGVTSIALLTPLTFAMDADQAFILLLSAFVASTVAGSITAILVGVPGTSKNAATVFDGYAMGQSGKAVEALATSSSASFFGAMVGGAVLMGSLPILRRFILSFGPPEFLFLIVWGLVTIGAVSGRSLLSGLIGAAIGLLLSFVGVNPVLGGARYTGGTLYLWDGFSLGTVFLGLFAVATALDVARKKGSSGTSGMLVKAGKDTQQLFSGILAPFRHFWLFIRCSIIGTIVGIMPGAGGTVASFICYGHAVQTSRDKSRYGQGDIRGVVAPECANNASQMGALIPTLTFGIPGSEGTALLLGAFLIHGINPGPELYAGHLSLIWVIIWTTIFGNLLASAITIVAGPSIALMTKISKTYMVPIILCVSLYGAYTFRQNVMDVLLAVVFGLFGLCLSRFSVPKATVVIAFVLGRLAEQAFYRTVQIGRGSFAAGMTGRPIAWVFIILTVLTVLLPYAAGLIGKTKKGGNAGAEGIPA
ncbi:MAG TPA: tripartite tricarboxylate transporter permease [Clostridia bacterium]|nr:tripartite tricarboxylate transporter permease [Clostridia bacterium]